VLPRHLGGDVAELGVRLVREALQHPEGLLEREAVALEVWLDRCSVEVFADEGRVVLTFLVFPQPDSAQPH